MLAVMILNVSECGSVHVCRCLWRPEALDVPGAGGTGVCELSHLNAGNLCVLCENIRDPNL